MHLSAILILYLEVQHAAANVWYNPFLYVAHISARTEQAPTNVHHALLRLLQLHDP